MKSSRDWYFKYWEPTTRMGPNGRPKIDYIYKGPFFQLPEKHRRFKMYCVLAMIFSLVCFLYLNLFPSRGGLTPRINGTCLLNIIPLFCCISALPALLSAPRAMTYRRYHRCIYRMKWACALSPLILLLHLIFEIQYIVRNDALSGEAVYLTVLAADFLVTSLLSIRFLRMNYPLTDKSDGIPANE